MVWAIGFHTDAGGLINAETSRQDLRLKANMQNSELAAKGFNTDGTTISGGPQDVMMQNSKIQSQMMSAMQEKLNALQGQQAAGVSDKALKDWATTGDTSSVQNALN